MSLVTSCCLHYLHGKRQGGQRSPSTVRTLQKICSQSRQSLRLVVESQQKRAAYAPGRVELEGDSYAAIDRAAKTLSVAYTETPASWLVAKATGSVAEYMD